MRPTSTAPPPRGCGNVHPTLSPLLHFRARPRAVAVLPLVQLTLERVIQTGALGVSRRSATRGTVETGAGPTGAILRPRITRWLPCPLWRIRALASGRPARRITERTAKKVSESRTADAPRKSKMLQLRSRTQLLMPHYLPMPAAATVEKFPFY